MDDTALEAMSNLLPIDWRVVSQLSEQYPIDPDYLSYLGGEPQVGVVQFGEESVPLEYFLALVDSDSKLPGPFRPHFEHGDIDNRVICSVSYLMDSEHKTSRCLFDCLVPFAVTERDMCIDSSYVDLFCFNYRGKEKPTVVLWRATDASTEYDLWDDLPFENQFDENGKCKSVEWDSF